MKLIEGEMTENAQAFVIRLGLWAGMAVMESPLLEEISRQAEEPGEQREVAMRGLAGLYATLPLIAIAACLRAPEWAQAVRRMMPQDMWAGCEAAAQDCLLALPITIEDDGGQRHAD